VKKQKFLKKKKNIYFSEIKLIHQIIRNVFFFLNSKFIKLKNNSNLINILISFFLKFFKKIYILKSKSKKYFKKLQYRKKKYKKFFLLKKKFKKQIPTIFYNLNFYFLKKCNIGFIKFNNCSILNLIRFNVDLKKWEEEEKWESFEEYQIYLNLIELYEIINFVNKKQLKCFKKFDLIKKKSWKKRFPKFHMKFYKKMKYKFKIKKKYKFLNKLIKYKFKTKKHKKKHNKIKYPFENLILFYINKTNFFILKNEFKYRNLFYYFFSNKKKINLLNNLIFKYNEYKYYLSYDINYNIFELLKLHQYNITSKYNFIKRKKKKKKRKIIYYTRHKLKFILPFYGFLLKSHTFKTKNMGNIKKNLSIFPTKNNLEKFIIRKYSFNPKIFNIHKYKKNLFEYKNINYLFLKKKKIISNQNFDYLITNKISDKMLNIRRFKFKPGYYKILKNARFSLKKYLNLKFTYQHRLTKYLYQYVKILSSKLLFYLEFRLNKFLYKSKLLTDLSVINNFIKNSYVYINGNLITNENYKINIYDIIQMVISYKYYIIYKWLYNWNIKKKNKIKKYFFKNLKISKKNDSKSKRLNYPSWIKFLHHLNDDIPKYLEVDFFSLSCIYLYEPISWKIIDSYYLENYKVNILNMYNWKYIT